jgi:hypothetical protein
MSRKTKFSEEAMGNSITAAVVLCLCLLSPSVFGQTKSARASENQSTSATPSAMPPEGSSEPEQQPDAPEKSAPVLWVTSVEAISTSHGPQLDVIRVRGITSTDGWEAAELIPFTKGVPADGMLDLAFVAQPPSDSTAPSKSPVIEAVFTLEPGHPFKGVRVHGATNRVSLRSIPGYSEAPAPPSDCSDCVGKYFVGKGETPPAGASSANIVREESLPKTLRVVRPTDGIRKLDADPNRLTLVIEEDGKIVVAVWD